MVPEHLKKQMASVDFDRDGVIPLYYQLQEAISEWIADGVLKPHDRLPSENELCAQFGVSRNTAQKALKAVVDKGGAYRVQGRGTFVADRPITYSITAKLSFSSEIIGLTKKTRSVLKFSRVMPASAHIARLLEIAEGDEVTAIQRVRTVDEIPSALMTSYLPSELVPDLLNVLRNGNSLFQAIKQEYGLSVASGYETLQSVHADEYEAQQLNISTGAAVFLLERVSRTEDGRILELVKTILRGDISKFSVELS